MYLADRKTQHYFTLLHSDTAVLKLLASLVEKQVNNVYSLSVGVQLHSDSLMDLMLCYL